MGDSVVFPELPTYLFDPSIAGLLSLVLNVLLPLFAGLLMRSTWTPFRKGLVLLALSAVKAFAEAWIIAINSAADFNFVTTLYSVLISFGIAVAAYFGVLRGTGIQQAALHGGPVRD